jgi:DNA-binding transcriptional MerR regulator
MKEVSEITGVSRETIRFYINEGLLPPPTKSARNMGWYSQHHIELLQLIQKLQHEQFLPLKAIKSLVSGSSEIEFTDSQELVLDQIRRKLSFGSRGLALPGKPAAIAKDLGLSRQELKEFAEIGLPLGSDATIGDAEVAELWVRLKSHGITRERGFTPKDLFYLVELVDLAVQQEMRFLSSRILTMTPDEATNISETVIPTLSRIFAILHERRLGQFIQRYLNEHAAAQAKPRSKVRTRRR